MADYVDKEMVDAICMALWSETDAAQAIKDEPPENVIEKEKILTFIEENRPTDVQTDWERGCAYICDEIEKMLK